MYRVADLIIRIKNAYLAHRKEIRMPYSRMTKAIADVLVKEQFLAKVKEEEVDGKKMLVADLRYARRKPVVSDVLVISKPSLRVYITAGDVKNRHMRDAKIAVLSTNKGVMTGKEAIKQGVGGELLFKIW
ncbi:MAG: 30S ribosomal protein S8 [Candidatus Levybacteria bacterium]|nr:30S ribosomal protein S8 [Candidatus Levybacteria bacterium]